MENKLHTTLSNRKSYEHKFDYKINKKSPLIIRLDGLSFSKFTKGFKKPRLYYVFVENGLSFSKFTKGFKKNQDYIMYL